MPESWDNLTLDQLVVKSKRMVEIPENLKSIQMIYYNRVMKECVSQHYNFTNLMQHVKDYFQIRMNQALRDPEFREQLQTDRGEMLTKILREEVFAELGMDRATVSTTDLNWKQLNMPEDKELTVKNEYITDYLPDEDNAFDDELRKYFEESRAQHRQAMQLY